MESVRGVHFLLWSEAAFSYAIETIKSFNQIHISNELWLKFINPHDIPFLYLYSCALIAFVMAGLSDSLIGRFYPTMIGLILAGISGIFHVLHYQGIFIMITNLFLFGYIISSTLRIVLILEQMRIPKHNDRVRKYIFFMVLFKLCAMCLSNAVYDYVIGKGDDINKYVSLTIIFAYILWFMIFVLIFYIESVYFGIWYYTIRYGWTTVRERAMSVMPDEDKPEEKKKKKMFEKKVDHLDEPAATLELYGLRFIFYHVRVSPPPKEKIKAPNFVVATVGKMRDAMRKFFKVSESTKSPEEAEETGGFLGRRESQLINVERKSKYVNYQLGRFLDILPILISSVFFSFLDYIITSMCTIQSLLFVREDDVFIHRFEVSHFNCLLDIILILFVEFVVFPVTKKVVKRDVVYYLIGFGFLIASSVMLVVFHAKAIKGKEYLPGPRAAQIRFVNGLNIDVSMTSSKFDKVVTVAPYDFGVVQVDMQHRNERIVVNFTTTKMTEGKSFSVIYDESGTTTYVVHAKFDNATDFVVLSSKLLDPTVFGKTRDRFLSTYFVVPALPAYHLEVSQLKFTNLDKDISKDIVQQIGDADRKYYIEPGWYDVQILTYHDLRINKTLVTDPFEFVKDKLYVIIVHYENKYVNARMYYVDEPLKISYTYTLGQLLLASIARALATVSFFRFLYLEGPHKLRGLVFTTPFVFNCVLVAIFDKPFIEKLHGSQLLFMIIVVAANLVLYLVWIFFGLRFPHRYEPYE